MSEHTVVPFKKPEHVYYKRAAVHEGVPITSLIRALNRAGFTFSTVAGQGLVIHVIGQHPELPSWPAITPKDPA